MNRWDTQVTQAELQRMREYLSQLGERYEGSMPWLVSSYCLSINRELKCLIQDLDEDIWP